MKTFKEFYDICEEQKRKLKDIIGRGVPSERPSSTTSLERIARRTPSDMARPRGNTSGLPSVTPLNRATYHGRVEAGRDPRRQYADNPDYTGPVRGSGSGTRDRMPGTTPSSNPYLPKKYTKGTLPSETKRKPRQDWV